MAKAARLKNAALLHCTLCLLLCEDYKIPKPVCQSSRIFLNDSSTTATCVNAYTKALLWKKLLWMGLSYARSQQSFNMLLLNKQVVNIRQTMGRFLAIASLVLLLLLVSQMHLPVEAQPGLDSRVSRLESDLVGIQNRLNQLQGSVSRQGGISTPALGSLSEQRSRRVTSADPQFDRLATLVIELKERVTSLEERLTRFERR